MITTEKPTLQEFHIEGVKHITPSNAQAAVKNNEAIIIDVREEKEFKAGSIAGAIHISRGQLASRIDDAVPDKSSPIVCFCAVGHRSAIAADTLQQLGYRNVTSMAGGLKSYLVSSSDRKSA